MDLKIETKESLNENPRIREALELFRISEEQYRKAILSLQGGTFTSDTTNLSAEQDRQWTNKQTPG